LRFRAPGILLGFVTPRNMRIPMTSVLSIFKSPLATVLAWLALCLPGLGGTELWVTGYYPAYRQAYLPPAAIDLGVVTHIIHFSVAANTDGSLNMGVNGLNAGYANNLVATAHAGGRKALICVGGAGSQPGFQGATTAANRPKFISSLTNFLSIYGYDGVDVDWEPLPVTDFNQYTNFIKELRSSLDSLPTRKLLTAAAGAYPSYGDPPTSYYRMFAALQDRFDQINVMTYDLAGPYDGWVTWFNSPIFDGGYRFPSTGALLPSLDGAISNFMANSVMPAKLGIGIAFYGDLWAAGAGTSTGGASAPRQSWTTAPTMNQVAYFDILASYYQSNRYHWDDDAQAAYLSVDASGSANDQFLTYDDEHTCEAKTSYARNHFLGGLMIWELGQGYLPSQPVGRRDPLLQAIRQTLATPRLTGIQIATQDVQLTFSSAPLANYRVQWTDSVSVTSTWHTLTNGQPGSSNGLSLLQVTDPGALIQSQRFYRVQTPP